MLDFELPFALLDNLNTRKEGENQEILAIDLKVNQKVSAKLIDNLMCEGINEGDAMRCFWTESDDEKKMDPRFLYLNSISFNRIFTNVKARMFDIDFDDCDLKKFSFVPSSEGMARLTFSISISNPPANVIEKLAMMLKDSFCISFTMPPQAELFGGPAL